LSALAAQALLFMFAWKVGDMKKLTSAGCVVLLLAGCSSGNGGSNSSRAQNAAIGSAGVTAGGSQARWDVLASFTATPDDSITALHVLPTGEVLAGHATTGVDLVDTQGLATFEDAFGPVSSFAAAGNGRLFAGTSDPFFAANPQGQVYERSSTGWSLALDHPLNGVVVGTLGGDVYAFASSWGDPAVTDATVSVMPVIAGAWQIDVADLADTQVTCAAEWNGELWVGGSANNPTSGSARLWHGANQTWSPAALPGQPANNTLQVVADVVGAGPDLFVAIMDVDTLRFATASGRVLHTRDGVNWSELRSYTNDAPASLAWHDGALYVGTLSGVLQREGQTEPGVPATNGVLTLLSLDAATLLAGARGLSGAEVLRRQVISSGPASPAGAAPANTGFNAGFNTGFSGSAPAATGTAPATQPTASQPAPSMPGNTGVTSSGAARTYLGDIKPILQASCAACHADPADPANMSFPLSAGLTDDITDWSQVQNRLNPASPADSLLLRKATGAVAHGGGQRIAPNGPQYNAIVEWIGLGTPLN
jgi:hypothetical protein